jgi:perosamine synthetase
MQAATGLVHLRHLDEFVATRQRAAARYTDGLAELGALTPLPITARSSSNYYKYVALLADGIDRASLKDALRTRFDIALSGEVYDTPLHLQPVFEHLSDKPLPVAEHVCARHVCLPVHSDMTDAEVDAVLVALHEAVAAE